MESNLAPQSRVPAKGAATDRASVCLRMGDHPAQTVGLRIEVGQPEDFVRRCDGAVQDQDQAGPFGESTGPVDEGPPGQLADMQVEDVSRVLALSHASYIASGRGGVSASFECANLAPPIRANPYEQAVVGQVSSSGVRTRPWVHVGRWSRSSRASGRTPVISSFTPRQAEGHC